MQASDYLSGKLYYDRTANVPHGEYQIQMNKNIDLLFRFGNVKYLKVICSLQYFAEEDLKICVIRIHADTYEKFKDLIDKLNIGYHYVHGQWQRRSYFDNILAQDINNEVIVDHDES